MHGLGVKIIQPIGASHLVWLGPNACKNSDRTPCPPREEGESGRRRKRAGKMGDPTPLSGLLFDWAHAGAQRSFKEAVRRKQ